MRKRSPDILPTPLEDPVLSGARARKRRAVILPHYKCVVCFH